MRNFDQGARSLPTERALHDWISPPYLEALSKTENGRGCTASSALPRPNGDEGSCLSKGWKFWTQDELRNARAKTHVNGKGARGWCNYRRDLFKISHNPSRAVARAVPNLCNRMEFSRSKIDARGNTYTGCHKCTTDKSTSASLFLAPTIRSIRDRQSN